MEKAEQEGQKKLRELSAQKFACGPDALVAAQTLSKQLNYHNLTDIKIEHSLEKNRKLSQKEPKEFYRTHLISFCQSGRIAKSGGLKAEGGVNGVFKRRNRLIVGNNRAIITEQEENKTPSADKAASSQRDIVSTQEWLQLGRLTQRFSTLFNGLLALQTVV